MKLMPYIRAYKNRRYRRYNRKLSNKNIYAHKSAMSQAVQIAALRNKINKVYRATKPEMKTKQDSSASSTTLNSTTSTISIGSVRLTSGSEDTQRIGDKVYRRDTFYLTFEYVGTYSILGTAGTPIRVICGAWKTPTSWDSVPSISSIISNSAAGTITSISPLVAGITENHDIFYDKTFLVNVENNQKVLKIKTPWYLCRFGESDACNHAWLIVKAASLTTSTSPSWTESVNATVLKKTVFRDA